MYKHILLCLALLLMPIVSADIPECTNRCPKCQKDEDNDMPKQDRELRLGETGLGILNEFYCMKKYNECIKRECKVTKVAKAVKSKSRILYKFKKLLRSMWRN